MRTEEEIQIKWNMLSGELLNNHELNEIQQGILKANINVLEWVMGMRESI